jgi:membrane protease YdiL (CAAX protease family)
VNTTDEKLARRRALIALLLLAPVPSFGVTAAMIIAPGPVGKTIFSAAKIWLLLFPAIWYFVVDRGRPSCSPPRNGGLGVGLATGVAAAAAIGVAAWVFGVFEMNMTELVGEVEEMGLADPRAYLGGALGWTFVNSLMEEYVYRWFVLSRCEQLMPRFAAILTSAGIFTAHHVIALSTYLPIGLTALASMGVFIGGVLWAALYSRYRSIWPCWISHVLADAAIFAVGWELLFG